MRKIIDKYFSQIDLDAIKNAIQKAELTTSGEIVIELTGSSRNWHIERIMYALPFTIICTLVTLYLTRNDNWGVYYNTSQAMLWGAIGFVLFYFGFGRFLKRAERCRKVVWKKALQQFGNLTPTRDSTGVLIYLSLEEKQVSIVADKGIASKLSEDYWHKPQAIIAKAMQENRHAEGIIEAIDKISVELAKHFPRRPDDTNELPDRPTIID